jgi:hypothetical protein
MLRLVPRVFSALRLRTSKAARLLTAPIHWCYGGVRPRTHRRPAARLMYLRQRRSFRPSLETLETRELRSTTPGLPDLSEVRNDLTQFRNDMTTSAVTLVNAARPSPTNTPTAASVHNEWSTALNVLVTDWSKAYQD